MEKNLLAQGVVMQQDLLTGEATDSPRRRCSMDLLQAIETQPSDTIREMIKAKRRSIQLFNLGYKALVKAIEAGRTDVVNDLLDKQCKVNLDKLADRPCDTPLHLAVKNGDLSLVDRLLEANASFTVVDERGNTPLHLAFLHKKGAIIDRILQTIQKKSNYVNVRNRQGLTHMHIACTRRNFLVIKRFLDVTMLTVTPPGKNRCRKVIVREEC